jgi:hypothetical protein
MAMKYLKTSGAIALAMLLFTSCEKSDYTCRCQVGVDQGWITEELQIGYAPKNTAQKRCYNYQKSRTEEMRGTKQSIRCRVETDL